MTIEVFASVASIVGSLAVLVSLIYVAVQLRQANAQLVRNEANATFAHYSSLRTAVIADKDIARIWDATMRDLPLKDPLDVLRSEMLITEHLWGSFHVWDRSRLGLIPKDHWQLRGSRLAARLITTTRGRAVWEQERERQSPPFVAALEAVAAELSAS